MNESRSASLLAMTVKTEIMAKETKYVKVLWIKCHWDYAYSAGMNGIVDAERAPELIKGGFVIPIPDAEDKKVNTLPEDFPGRDKLFNMGFETVQQVKDAGEALLDEGISQTMLKKIMKYGE